MSLQEAALKAQRACVVQYPYYICASEQSDSKPQPTNFNLRFNFYSEIIFEQQCDDQNDGKSISARVRDGDLQPAEKNIEEQKQYEGRVEAQIPDPFPGKNQHERREQEHPEHIEELTDKRQRRMIERASHPDHDAGYSHDRRITSG